LGKDVLIVEECDNEMFRQECSEQDCYEKKEEKDAESVEEWNSKALASLDIYDSSHGLS